MRETRKIFKKEIREATDAKREMFKLTYNKSILDAGKPEGREAYYTHYLLALELFYINGRYLNSPLTSMEVHP